MLSPSLLVIVLIGAGLFGMAGAWFDWEWFMTHHKARRIVRLVGRGGARIVYFLMGIALVGGGVGSLLGFIDLPNETQHEDFIPSEVAQIVIRPEGTITFNRRVVTLEEVTTEIERLKEVGGAVEYSRDHLTEDAPPIAMAVVEVIARAGVPIKIVEAAE